jgi:flagellum-specific peptidoglycan hydrolase FlgJ
MLAIIIFYFGRWTATNDLNKSEINQTEECVLDTDTLSQEAICIEHYVWSQIKDLNIQHPHIVLAQARLESGNFSSELFKKTNNLFGMGVASRRANTSNGSYNKFSTYSSIRECIIDYALWQSRYASNLTYDEYLAKLGSTYAEDPDYIKKLEKIIEEITDND